MLSSICRISRFLFSSVILSVSLMSMSQASLRTPTDLEFYTWAGFINPDVVFEFEDRFNARIKFTYFDSDDTRDQDIAANAGRGFDVILVSGLQIEKYGKQGWLVKINRKSVPNSKLIDRRWANAYPGARQFGVAYFWGTMGIAYRQDLYPDGLGSWNDLIEPAEELRGRLLMPNNNRQLIALALMAKGISANSNSEAHISEATKRLLAQKPYVAGYRYPATDISSDLVSGAIVAAPTYSGDAVTLQEIQPGIEFVIPEEGGLAWVDYLTVPKTSEQKELAFEFINFLNEPVIAAKQAEYVRFATPNKEARKFLSSRFLSNPTIYPGKDVMSRSEFLRPLSARSQKRINTVSSEILY